MFGYFFEVPRVLLRNWPKTHSKNILVNNIIVYSFIFMDQRKKLFERNFGSAYWFNVASIYCVNIYSRPNFGYQTNIVQYCYLWTDIWYFKQVIFKDILNIIVIHTCKIIVIKGMIALKLQILVELLSRIKIKNKFLFQFPAFVS